MGPTNDIPIEWLRECFSVDETSGYIYWNRRPPHHFELARGHTHFNNWRAGKRADEDIYRLSGYRRVRVKYRGKKITLSAHRVVFALVHGQWPTLVVDHIDRDRLNNRPSNLRDVDASTNGKNTVRNWWRHVDQAAR